MIEGGSEIDERDVNVKDKFGKKKENINTIDAENKVPANNKECKGHLKEKTCSTLDEKDEIQFENIKSEIQNIFKGKGEKNKKGEIHVESKVKQR